MFPHRQSDRSNRLRRVVALVGVVACATWLLPAMAEPVAAATVPPRADWTVTLDSVPARSQRVGSVFEVDLQVDVLFGASFAQYYDLNYAVPDNFRIESAAVGDSPCTVVAQAIRCSFPVTYENGQARIFLTPLAPGQDIQSTVSVVGEQGEPNPDPSPNQVTFTNDVTSSLVDLEGALFTYSESGQSQGTPFTLDGSLLNSGSNQAIEFSAVLEVPEGFAIGAVQLQPGQIDPFSIYPGDLASGTCGVQGQTVTCEGISLPPNSYRFLQVEVTPTVSGTGLTSQLTLSSTWPSQQEVNPDPHPNMASLSIDVAANDLPAPVSGTVTDPTGAPVGGVIVLAYAPTDGFAPTAWATTGANGTYAMPPLPAGSYAVAFLPPATTGLPGQWSGGMASRSSATLVIVDGSGVTIAGINAQLKAAASIAGTVRGPGGTALSGVPVLAFVTGTFWIPAASTVSASDGSYRFDGLPAGSYDVVFRPAASSGLLAQWYQGQLLRSTADPLILSAGTETSGIDADLVAGGGLSGRATGPGGAALPGTRVVAYGPGDTWVGSYETTTAADGSFVLAGLRTAPYQIRFVPPVGSGLTPLWYRNTPSRARSIPVQVTATGTQTSIDAAWAPSA